MREAKELLEIIRCFINNIEYTFEGNIDEEKIYKLAQKHNVSNFMQKWAKTNCKSDRIKKEIENDYNNQIVRDTNENIELENILNEMESAEIQTLVVKGAVMKEVYPQSYMRQMCDIDIMIHQEEFKKASKIMHNLGYDEFYDHEKHLIFTKKPFIIIEMHRKLIPGGDVSHEYFNNIWSNCIQYKDYKNIYKMDINDAYVFCIIHLMRHLKYAGIEIKDLLDVYLYNKKYKEQLDYEKVNQKLEEFGVKEFEENIKKIAYNWFDSKKQDDFNDVEKFILKGASIDNQVNYEVGEKQGKTSYIFRLLFPELKIMKEKYPVLKKAPILLPATWIARIFKDIFSRETTIGERFDTIKLIQDTKTENVEYIQNIYKKIGLKGDEK